MKISDLAPGTIWGIEPTILEAIFTEYSAITDPDVLSAKLSRFIEEPQERDEFLLKDGVAVIPVTGPLSKRGGLWQWFFGGSSLADLSGVFEDAMQNPDVSAIVLDIDSPGGVVSGTDALASQIYKARGVKPVVSFANGMMASAAYWLGSAAQKIVVENTAQVGSIGVVMVHYDYSKGDEKYGLKRTYLTAGKYKALGNDAEPLSDLARKTFQSDLDYIYSLFVDTVAQNRKAEAQTVIKNMADGRIFTGQQAIDAGLADIAGSLETAIETARKLVKPAGSNIINVYGGQKMDKITTIEQLAAAYPDLVNQVRGQALEKSGAETETACKQAITDERTRVLGLADIQFGKEGGEKFRAVIEAGVSVEQFTAIRGAAGPAAGAVDPEKAAVDKAKADMLAAIQGSGAENPGAGGGKADGLGFLALVDQHCQGQKCSKAVAMQAVAMQYPKAHAAFLEGCN